MKNSKKLFLLVVIASCTLSNFTHASQPPLSEAEEHIEEYIKDGNTRALASMKNFDPNKPMLVEYFLNIKKYCEQSPLQLAALRYKNRKSVKFLLEKGADPSMNPDLLCRAMSYKVPSEIVEDLLKYGAYLNAAGLRDVNNTADIILDKMRSFFYLKDTEDKNFIDSYKLLITYCGPQAAPREDLMFDPFKKRHEWAKKEGKLSRRQKISQSTNFIDPLVDIVESYCDNRPLFDEKEYLAANPESQAEQEALVSGTNSVCVVS
jgi:hypothetical protein